MKPIVPGAFAAEGNAAPFSVTWPVTFTARTSRSSAPLDVRLAPAFTTPELHGSAGATPCPQALDSPL